MIDVRVPRSELDAFMHPGTLEHMATWGLLRIDLFPPAAGPEVELTFAGDTPAHVDRIREKIAGMVRLGRPGRGGGASLTVLAARLRPHGTEADPPYQPGDLTAPTRRHETLRRDRW